ncbi:MAG: DUF3108 domain-containing protein [Candidatus Omnitrophota bacterium]
MKVICKITAVIFFLLIAGGCASSLWIKDRCIMYDPKTRSFIAADKKIPTPSVPLRVGEKLMYEIRWLGLKAGEATLWVKEIVEYEGRQAYHIQLTVESNAIISKIYKVKDEVHSFIDCKNFHSLRFEKNLREGGYRCNEIMEYDQESGMGIYKTPEKKLAMTIPRGSQDALSCLYYYRFQNVEIGESVFVDVNADEKNWKLEIKAIEAQVVEVANQGRFNAFLVEPLAKFKGIFVRKGKLLVWFSADERRLPLVLKLKFPVIGSLAVVLTNIE